MVKEEKQVKKIKIELTESEAQVLQNILYEREETQAAIKAAQGEQLLRMIDALETSSGKNNG